jgi:mannose-6-phosphate isomerase
LKCGEAIYLAANIPHAYLFGDGVECMACSDNVVRAGLTPKFKDVNVLCDMLDYTMRSADDNKQASIAHPKFDYITEFRPNVDEFSVEQIKIETRHLNEAKKLLIPKRDSASILIVNRFGLSKGTFQTNDAKTLPVKAGWAYYLNASVDFYFEADEVLNEQDTVILLAYRAYCDIKN